MQARGRPIIVVLALLALAACGGPTIQTERSLFWNTGSIRPSGQFGVLMLNPPGGGPPAAFTAALMPALPNGTGLGAGVTFVPIDGLVAASGNVVLLDFQGSGPSPVACSEGATPDALAARTAAPTVGRIVMTATLCEGASPAAFAIGSVEGRADPADPALRSLVRGLVIELFAQENRDRTMRWTSRMTGAPFGPLHARN